VPAYLSDTEIEETVTGIEEFWKDRSTRNRLIHDEWAPDLANPLEIAVRGLTKKRVPEESLEFSETFSATFKGKINGVVEIDSVNIDTSSFTDEDAQ
jgi:hypothetical protein